MTRIFHNPRCGKSREALALLERNEKDFTIVEYLKTPPTKAELAEIIKMLGIKPHDLIRTKEAEYVDHYKGKNLSDEEWLDAMIAYPKLIERPIVIKDGKAAIGRPAEKILDIL